MGPLTLVHCRHSVYKSTSARVAKVCRDPRLARGNIQGRHGWLDYVNPVGEQEHFDSDEGGQGKAVLQGETQKLGLLANRDSSSGGGHGDGLEADHLAQNASGRVGSAHEDLAEAEALSGDG